MSPIELTEEQCKLIEADHGKPVDVIDPATNRTYVLVASELFDRIRAALPPQTAPLPRPENTEADLIPPGIVRSQQAFWRDLPALLKMKKNFGKWACYHGDECIGIARSQEGLIRECLRRGLRDDEYDLDVIEPHTQAPWEIEEIEAGGHEVDDVDLDDLPGNAGKPT